MATRSPAPDVPHPFSTSMEGSGSAVGIKSGSRARRTRVNTAAPTPAPRRSIPINAMGRVRPRLVMAAPGHGETPFRDGCEGLENARVRIGKSFRQHARVRYRGHEVRVAGPARHEVPVQVAQYSRSRRAPEIGAEVESIRTVRLGKGAPRAIERGQRFGTHGLALPE